MNHHLLRNGYRTTIPREVRKLLGIGESDEAEWVFEDSKVIVRNRMISYLYCDFERGLRLIKTWRYRFYDVTSLSALYERVFMLGSRALPLHVGISSSFIGLEVICGDPLPPGHQGAYSLWK